MTTIRRPWPPALRWAARHRKPILIRLRTLTDRARTRVFEMRRHAGAVTWEFVEEIAPSQEVQENSDKRT